MIDWIYILDNNKFLTDVRIERKFFDSFLKKTIETKGSVEKSDKKNSK